MKIRFDGIMEGEAKNVGSFVIVDESDNPIYHFLYPINDEVKMKQTLKKHLTDIEKQVAEKKQTEQKIKTIVDSINVEFLAKV